MMLPMPNFLNPSSFSGAGMLAQGMAQPLSRNNQADRTHKSCVPQSHSLALAASFFF
jgi:hypothetical protein